jgi:phage-related protein
MMERAKGLQRVAVSGRRRTAWDIKHIEDRLWEMRLRGRGGIARSLYVTASGRRVVILRTFVKKTQKTPHREIELALKRAREVI